VATAEEYHEAILERVDHLVPLSLREEFGWEDT
jgi:hypothetical protein